MKSTYRITIQWVFSSPDRSPSEVRQAGRDTRCKSVPGSSLRHPEKLPLSKGKTRLWRKSAMMAFVAPVSLQVHDQDFKPGILWFPQNGVGLTPRSGCRFIPCRLLFSESFDLKEALKKGAPLPCDPISEAVFIWMTRPDLSS